MLMRFLFQKRIFLIKRTGSYWLAGGPVEPAPAPGAKAPPGTPGTPGSRVRAACHRVTKAASHRGKGAHSESGAATCQPSDPGKSHTL